MKVFTTVENSDQFRFIQNTKLKIARIIDINSENLCNVITEETNGCGVDHIFDTNDNLRVSNQFKRDIIACLACHGTWVASYERQLDPPETRTLLFKNIKIGFLNEQIWLLCPNQHGRYLHMLNDLLQKSLQWTSHSRTYKTFSLDNIQDAHKEVEHHLTRAIIKY